MNTMNIHQAKEFIEESDKFKKFIKENEHYYFAHAFTTIEKTQQAPWQLGYYSQKDEKIISFTAGEEVTQAPPDEAFIKEGHVPEMDIEKVQTKLDDALKQAHKIHEENHKAELITKTIVILQTLEEKAVWNVTLITHAFNMINVHVAAEDGHLMKNETHSILNLGKRV